MQVPFRSGFTPTASQPGGHLAPGLLPPPRTQTRTLSRTSLPQSLPNRRTANIVRAADTSGAGQVSVFFVLSRRLLAGFVSSSLSAVLVHALAIDCRRTVCLPPALAGSQLA